MFPLTSPLSGFARSMVRHSFLSCSLACRAAAAECLLEFGSSREAFGVGEAPARRLLAFKVLGSGDCENHPQRAFIASSPSACLCMSLFLQQACPVLTHNKPEIAPRLTLYFYVCFTRNVFSHLIIILLLCGKVVSIESD